MYKYILGKVSFDKNIFKKELTKALKNLKHDEAKSLVNWCRISFDEQLLKGLESIDENQESAVMQLGA
ncbi:MAG TPA: hypothetical protein VF868_07245 [Bacteroidia bacterium]